MTKLRKPPNTTDHQWDVINRPGATDEQIEEALRDERFWSFILRNPEGRPVAWGIDTMGAAIRFAFDAEQFCDRAGELFPDTPASFGPWRFVLWPPKAKPGHHNNWWNDPDLQDPRVPEDYIEMTPDEKTDWREHERLVAEDFARDDPPPLVGEEDAAAAPRKSDDELMKEEAVP